MLCILQNRRGKPTPSLTRCIGISLLLLSSWAYSGVLPEERADLLYHSYDGGGVTIAGPSVLVRKNINDKYSVYSNYYVDMVTSASIDVLATASKYTEERTEYSLGLDYLNDRTLMSGSYTNSSESDYTANTFSVAVSQEFFGDLSTLTLAYAQGSDTVKANGAPTFSEDAGRKRYSLGFSQILTHKLLSSFSYEAVIDEGYLNNPYRRVRVADSGEPLGYRYVAEHYPRTRNSEAYALRGIYALNNHASLRGEYRRFSDSWGIAASNSELRYTHQLKQRWLLELRYRQYNQHRGADFYQDLFDFSIATPEFLARDKELSTYSSQQLGIGISYTFNSRFRFFNDSQLHFHWDTMTFDYSDFRDLTLGSTDVGKEPLYKLKADVIRVYFSSFF
ncbi:MAG: DUF3570 domain-containing protein [Cellvibrionaceae bacterium]|nr:DUF3570 domain-containing protein [Cellvibrionaceae bacterium]